MQPIVPPHSIRTFERPVNSDGTLARVPQFFGSHVFEIQAMSKKLNAQDLEVMSQVMRLGGKIDQSLAGRVAAAVKEWAVEMGATHYCHWFQPQTGSTAEKHDAFLWFKDGKPLERFTAGELLQSEPDASSFPSGGIRSTFEARGYTGWDPSSPMFVMETENGKTLYIPSFFISYHGDALDYKVPLLRSNDVLSKTATQTLKLIGESKVTHVTNTVGPEQEFFLIYKKYYDSRPDLQFSGRTVLGRKPTKGQELEDHYFGHIPASVHAFMNELEIELYKLGVPIKTRHNEVAPGQFEIAPIFESSNVAVDHNQLVMKTMRYLAPRHGFAVLFHEKPFAGVNGSGKHVNWSLCDSTGRNLLDPGHTPQENMVFLTFLCAVLQGIADNADLLRVSIASAGNDHRLGANEAPPAIMSVFLGDALDRVLNGLEQGTLSSVNIEKMFIDMGASHLQNVAKDNTDRNRTSPFAFTGNKFEFRAVGSSANISFPVTVLNAAVSDGLQKLNRALEKKASPEGAVTTTTLLEVLKEVVKQTRFIRFEGNGYGQEWKEEAARRGINEFPNTPAALAVLSEPAKVRCLVENEILNPDDILSRHVIQLERYVKQTLIEVNTGVDMIQTGILPAGLNYLAGLVTLTREASQIGIPSPAQRMATEVGSLCSRVEAALHMVKVQLDRASSQECHDTFGLTKLSHQIAQSVLPKFEELRGACDELEALVPHASWPFPKYRHMLFGFD